MDSDLKNSVLKTGTTVLGIVCKDGIVMGADRRVTAGHLVMSKKERKVKQITDYLVMSWTGGAADAFLSEKVIAAELRLKELKTKMRPTVKESAHLIGMMFYRNIRTPSMIPHIVGTLVGGYNEDGTFELYTIEPAGGVYKVEDYDANFSSGMPFVLGYLERQYNKNVTIKEGVELALESLKSSTQRDVASGNGIDIFTINKDGIKHAVSQEITATYS
ncbi:hypothetical protein CO038_03525 [Candidatus Pacearchaeota archaeon CG_4_9_14_0_2_um_filter_39_13]|nr:hypothetical protein [Candidatus Pacearchaeota archaeon]OIO43606.1 MAG: hypothetical protein AUJ64_02010 [Candidatus Pacearchaeota archaeon CG1_02_39_14]PJC44488.1 MAG: hypothetical protein CO038_03525 [Candidatus Pacearchaeota archaeon CG_4_9_14_0_2_um_filter_39_13]